MRKLFADRRSAGLSLTALLIRHAREEDAIVLALPRGGIPVAYEVARMLELPLDVYPVRKLGPPGHAELAMGAITRDGRVRGRVVIVVDDGLATGSTMKAAIEALRAQGARRVVVAVPVAPRETFRDFQSIADEIVVLETPEPFHGVGLWYEDFRETSDTEARALLAASASARSMAST